jgi:hypothetical protein
MVIFTIDKQKFHHVPEGADVRTHAGIAAQPRITGSA